MSVPAFNRRYDLVPQKVANLARERSLNLVYIFPCKTKIYRTVDEIFNIFGIGFEPHFEYIFTDSLEKRVSFDLLKVQDHIVSVKFKDLNLNSDARVGFLSQS
ncbi:uncharacterized protein LOC135119431 isoform X2 [Zophobas morio]|uniref:uncharacterized protein LOC135119431 isoform X2 n=1 Tax=Zophobas morio TaxID=2755281 RepID=UPI003083529C